MKHVANLAHELSVVCDLARRAGQLAMRMQSAGLTVDRKLGDEPVTEADRQSSLLIVAGLRDAFPGDAILSEEAPDDRERLVSERVWMIDPIDGTKGFIRGDDGYATMVGLLIGETPALGVVYQPRGDRLYFAATGQGCTLQVGSDRHVCRVSTVSRTEEMRMVASKSHRDESITKVRCAGTW